jgi:2-keto-4-pentenoate hydratase/2-oxohepta-3-ene-1,7-dioic acid hydratase in catechol pathway
MVRRFQLREWAMRICWFNDNRLGLVRDGRVFDVSAALKVLPAPTYPAPRGDPLISHLDKIKPAMLEAANGARSHAIGEVKFLSPVQSPTKVIGTPTNYAAHVAEAKEQVADFKSRYTGSIEEQGLFLKANSSLIGPGEGVVVRFPERRTDHEMELGIVIGRKVSNISEAEALGCIAGYACALDMVTRGTEDRSLRKSIDTYSVLGPWMTTADEVKDPQNLPFSLSVNGEIKQQSNTAKMIMGIARQIAWGSTFYTLWPGDIIMTGTCEGVSRVKPGDKMHCVIEGVGEMDVEVR